MTSVISILFIIGFLIGAIGGAIRAHECYKARMWFWFMFNCFGLFFCATAAVYYITGVNLALQLGAYLHSVM